MSKKANAFTIVELLVVIVVIAILAAISIVAYRGIQDRANSSAASSKVSQVAKKVLVYFAENETYPANLGDADVTDTLGLDYTAYNNSNPKAYCITATVSNKSYYVNSTTATSPTPGGCPGHGQGGIPAMTNMAYDPAATGSGDEYQSRWSLARSFISGASDGPTGGPSTYARFTVTTAVTGASRGTDHRGNSDNAQPYTGSNAWPVTAGVPVTVSIWTRSTVSNSGLRMVFRVHNGANAWVLPQVSSTTQTYTANSWVRLVRTYTPPASGYLTVGTWYSSSSTYPAGATLDFTGLMVTTGSTTGNYADGNSPNWAWNGSVNASSSSGPAL